MPVVSPKISCSEYFYVANVTDPRGGRSRHPLETILFVSICAVICGADDFVAIAKWGRNKKDWVSKFVDTSNGIPSHDRFNAVLASVRTEEFEKCWLDWIGRIKPRVQKKNYNRMDKKTRQAPKSKATGSKVQGVNRCSRLSRIGLKAGLRTRVRERLQIC